MWTREQLLYGKVTLVKVHWQNLFNKLLCSVWTQIFCYSLFDKYSLPKKHCSWELSLNYMVKFHWQIYRAMLSELSKICSCKLRTLTKWFDKLARSRCGKCDKWFLVCWHLAKMRNTISTLCPLYKVFKTNVMCGTRRPKSIRIAREKEQGLWRSPANKMANRS